MRALVLILFACGVGTCFTACLDTTPLDFTPEPVSDAGPDAPENPACRNCLSGSAGCKDAYAACFADETCAAVIDCSLVRSCLKGPTFEDMFVCTQPCLTATGLQSTANASLVLLMAVNQCVQGSCSAACAEPLVSDQ